MSSELVTRTRWCGVAEPDQKRGGPPARMSWWTSRISAVSTPAPIARRGDHHRRLDRLLMPGLVMRTRTRPRTCFKGTGKPQFNPASLRNQGRSRAGRPLPTKPAIGAAWMYRTPSGKHHRVIDHFPEQDFPSRCRMPSSTGLPYDGPARDGRAAPRSISPIKPKRAAGRLSVPYPSCRKSRWRAAAAGSKPSRWSTFDQAQRRRSDAAILSCPAGRLNPIGAATPAVPAVAIISRSVTKTAGGTCIC